jgi:hypothetical protein
VNLAGGFHAMDKRDGIELTIPLSPVKTMTAPCKQMHTNEIAT